MKGKFITLEGIDGAGKSSHLHWLMQRLEKQGLHVVVTREPGGTVLGERLRELLLHEPMHLETEALLMFAARREHLEQCIWPALAAGKWVISDRFTDASFAYQGGGRGLALERLQQLERWVQGDFQPDLTLLFDLAPAIARQRLQGTGQAPDRFELEELSFFTRVREAYLQRAHQHAARMRIIDASHSQDEIRLMLEEVVSTL